MEGRCYQIEVARLGSLPERLAFCSFYLGKQKGLAATQ